MKSLMKFVLFGLLAACTAHVTDESAAAVNTDGTPSKESLLERVEALFARGLAGVESVLHDAIGAVEDLFATDDGSTLDVSVQPEAPAVTTGDAESDPAQEVPAVTPAVPVDAPPAA